MIEPLTTSSTSPRSLPSLVPNHVSKGSTASPAAPRSRFASMPRLLVGLLLALGVWASFAPTPVSAHAQLLSSNPAAGEVLSTAPRSILLEFNEPVRPLRDVFELRSASSTLRLTARSSGSRIELEPSAPITEGSWVLVWEVESADGHPVADLLRFTVGTPTDSLPAPATRVDPLWQDRLLELSAWLAAVAALAGLLLANSRLVYGFSAALGFFAALRLVDFAERSGSAAFRLGEFRSTAMLLLAGVVVPVFLRFRPSLRQVAPLLLLGLFAAQGLFAGHHRLFEPGWLMLLVHPLHLAAALLWSSALLAMYLSPGDAALLVRASRLATWAVFALLPATLVLVVVMLAPAESFGRWEWTVALKAALTCVALLLGALNHHRLRGERDPLASARPIRVKVLVELVLLFMVAVGSASIATATPSARIESAVLDASRPSAPGLTLDLVFDDGSTGRLVFDALLPGDKVPGMLFVFSPDGSPLVVQSGEWELASPDLELSGLSGDLMPMGDHLYAFFTFPAAGVFNAKVIVQVDEFTSLSAVASFTVPEPIFQGGSS